MNDHRNDSAEDGYADFEFERRFFVRGWGWMRSKLPLQNPVTPA